jgi:hypothetical protein
VEVRRKRHIGFVGDNTNKGGTKELKNLTKSEIDALVNVPGALVGVITDALVGVITNKLRYAQGVSSFPSP